jgi:hypothetical protein
MELGKLALAKLTCLQAAPNPGKRLWIAVMAWKLNLVWIVLNLGNVVVNAHRHYQGASRRVIL